MRGKHQNTDQFKSVVNKLQDLSAMRCWHLIVLSSRCATVVSFLLDIKVSAAFAVKTWCSQLGH